MICVSLGSRICSSFYCCLLPKTFSLLFIEKGDTLEEKEGTFLAVQWLGLCTPGRKKKRKIYRQTFIFVFSQFLSLLHHLQDLSPSSRDQTSFLGSESTEFQPLDCQGIPFHFLLDLLLLITMMETEYNNSIQNSKN